jgi:hypothetical protein
MQEGGRMTYICAYIRHIGKLKRQHVAVIAQDYTHVNSYLTIFVMATPA